ncbi:MAG: AMIN domain-containing protein, partial [Myxococcota bacterium]
RLAREKAEAERLAAERAAAARAEKARLAHEKAEEKKLAGEAEAPASKRRQLTFVGFKLEPASARVYVRTDAPARYRISESDGETVMVELENTVIKLPNNQRFLDTSFFDTAVALVSPVEGPDRSVRVAIKLKRSVPYQARQEGNEVVVEFQK